MSICIAAVKGRFGVIATDTRVTFFPPGRPAVRMDVARKLVRWGAPARPFFSTVVGDGRWKEELFCRLLDSGAQTLDDGRLCIPSTPPLDGARTKAFTLGAWNGGPAVERWAVEDGDPYFQPMVMDPVRANYLITRSLGLPLEQFDRVASEFHAQLEAAVDQPGVLRAIGAAVLATAGLTDGISTTVDLGLLPSAGGGVSLRFEARDLALLGLPGGPPWTQGTVESAHASYLASREGVVEISFSRTPRELVTDFEVAGVNFGERVKISSVCPGIGPVKDTEVLYGAGYTLNTTSTTAATQEAAERSEVIRDSATAGALKTRILNAILTRNFEDGEGWLGTLAVAMDTGVQSLKITVPSHLVASDEGPPPYNPAANVGPWTYTVNATGAYTATVKNGEGGTYYLPSLGGIQYVTVVPYPAEDGEGTPGLAVDVYFGQDSLPARVVDPEGYHRTVPGVALAPGGTLKLDESSRIKLDIIIGTGPVPELAPGQLYGRYVEPE